MCCVQTRAVDPEPKRFWMAGAGAKNLGFRSIDIVCQENELSILQWFLVFNGPNCSLKPEPKTSRCWNRSPKFEFRSRSPISFKPFSAIKAARQILRKSSVATVSPSTKFAASCPAILTLADRHVTYISAGRRLRVPADLLPRHVVPGIRWRRREGLRLGLEDDQDVQQVQGSRQRLHRVHVASSRNIEAAHVRLGRPDQVVGLRGGGRPPPSTTGIVPGTGCPCSWRNTAELPRHVLRVEVAGQVVPNTTQPWPGTFRPGSGCLLELWPFSPPSVKADAKLIVSTMRFV